MTIQTMMAKKNMSMYLLAQISGLPKTTVIDICSGKSKLGNCTARTLQKLARALDCTMEELLNAADYDATTGKPVSEDYLRRGLPAELEASVSAMEASWVREDKGETDLHWDIYWCQLYADINEAETEQEISHEQAAYLRKKILRMEDDND